MKIMNKLYFFTSIPPDCYSNHTDIEKWKLNNNERKKNIVHSSVRAHFKAVYVVSLRLMTIHMFAGNASRRIPIFIIIITFGVIIISER